MAVTSYSGAEQYNFDIVKKFSVMALVWAVVGMFVGVYIASELAWPFLNFDSPYFSFGRFRPVHTSAVIFGFGGSALFATSYYVVQRTCQTRLISDGMASLTFWGWQTVIVLAALSYVMGYSQGREYAEMEWPIDILVEIVWVSYLILFVGTILRRKQPHIYVANWFYLAFILATALLHTFNNLAMPIDLFSIVPKQAGRPIYSYRLSIVHFWALGFMYMWVGAHHLHWTALPDWTSSLAAAFSILLLMPSWGGMINGIMTLSGAWDKLRTDPVMRFMIVALSFYGMSTFEGPMMSLKEVNALSHYTDWTVGHVHSGALGWVAMISFGSLYHMMPKLWDTKIYSRKLVEWHFWLATIGIVLYIVAMWISGITQGLMWRAFDEFGNLQYSFVESVAAMMPFYAMRAIGGMFFLTGAAMMAFNMFMTIRQGKRESAALEAKLAAKMAHA